MRAILFCGLLLVMSTGDLLGQVPAEQTSEKGENGFHLKNLAVKLDYFGELIMHPGASVGVEYSFYQNKKGWFDLHWDADFGGHYHRWNHGGLFMTTTLGLRFTAGFGGLLDFNLGPGYLHTFPEGDVYQRNSTGELQKVRSAGSQHFMPNVSLLLGWTGTKKNIIPLTFRFGPAIYMESHFNHVFLPHLALKAGFSYQFGKHD